MALFGRRRSIDRLGVPGPVVVGGTSHDLAWVGHDAQSVLQEYLPPGQVLDRYDAMVLLHAVVTDLAVEQAVAVKVGELQELRSRDPVVNFDLHGNADGSEIILDFVQSGVAGDGAGLVEWNGYRYTRQGSCLVLLGHSLRAYGDGVRPFLTGLRERRTPLLTDLGGLVVPPVRQPSRR